ncbi:Glutamyl-tRNA(Gln) amidotransferase subunit C,aspartyl/glutamyl-tRNA amidotransferase subunit C,aspartyl/glutamyl-tRNA(Asn/Gln) amidotransferase, C subunit,Glu-tRNAGln amidotransferase C subunit [Chlamydia poikilotherma]|uniref:Aspartyl/glutamyl-tRNA(Asn/Gln) amidotransferase subunit C n=2 Tax=Chlamydia TaxID=810 RepID=A0A3B0Q731_9CHLA|nr:MULTISPECIES: Asp-tRNA(Asn)/Glu-tRNA(Gln) amidotransferase subunit GatC [Chlamydia]QVE48839.1 Asp-tRNA(Asn)/Glu-tRNA(Gln) amidotransferase subunit GatC [Chlamydia crocodili]SYX08777.1 Glutamyl-tRNA(Gln) amidotransferase subunit C,aspartyl/glutamyl-tRNA amidotransferase subunit C,aspartyl/glutamyl-tRNA(Asn/Gln) amidotransferase, C subunit,Glu-tRNAGln amidotransferase C subunit [Chlamydia poikilotherma]
MTQPYVTREEILLLAKSSALELSEELIQEYETSLNEVIGIMKASISMDVTDVVTEVGLSHVISPEDLREDVVASSFSREEFLINVPESLGGLVKVPTVIK